MLKRLLAMALILALLIPASALAYSQTLELGVTGEEVKDAQTKLAALEYYAGPIDGIFSVEVQSAVRSFQRVNQLTVDGKIGKKTATALDDPDAIGKNDRRANGTMTYGSSGERIKDLQRALRDTYYQLVIFHNPKVLSSLT